MQTEMLPNLGFFNWILYIDLLSISVVISIYLYITHARSLGLLRDSYRKVEYTILGNKLIGFLPISFSFFGVYFSSITILGIPAELYEYGITIVLIVLSYVLANIILMIFFVPVFYHLQQLSLYEVAILWMMSESYYCLQYLGLRFSKYSQIMCSISFILQMMLYLGIVLYEPASAFSSVVDVNKWIIVLTIAVVCVIYTTIGGFVATVYTAIFQVTLIFVGMVPILIKGSNLAGGLNHLWEYARTEGRTRLDVSFSLHDRCSLFGVIIGGTFMWTGMVCVTQPTIQRVNACKTITHARLAIFFNLFQMVLLIFTQILCGLIICFKFCHLNPAEKVIKSNALLVEFILQELQQYPGLLGLFLISIMSGSLSTLSAGLNSIAAVTLRNILPMLRNDIGDRTGYASINLFTTIYGFVIIWFAYLSSLSENIIQLSYSIFALVSGPVLGVFSLGIFTPLCNNSGAIAGHITSQLFLLFIMMGKMVAGIYYPSFINNITVNSTPKAKTRMIYNRNYLPISGLENLYAISFYWYSPIGFLMCVIVGSIVSHFTENDGVPRYTQKQLISPLFWNLWLTYLEDDKTPSINEQTETQCDETRLELSDINVNAIDE